MEPPSSWPSWHAWAALAVFLLLAALASSAETALLALSRRRLHHLREAGLSRAQAVEAILARPDVLASTIHLISLIGTIGATSMITWILWRLQPAVWIWYAAAGVAFVIILIFGQIVPRVVAAQQPEFAATVFARPVELLANAFAPFLQAVAFVTSALLGLVGVRRQAITPLVTEEQFRMLASAAEDIEETERDMIDGIFELDQTVAREIMVPRVDIVAVPSDCAVDEAVDVALGKGKTRLPVYADSLDHIVGVVHAHDLFRRLRQGQGGVRVGDIARPAYFIPDSKRVDDLLSEMRHSKTHLAIVVDEYGGTAGLVTIEDLLEEIVGEIRDEYEGEEEKIERISDDEVIFDATVSIGDVNDTLDLGFGAEEYDTIGGLVYHQLAKMPAPGDLVEISGVARIEVLSTSGNRIRKVRVRKEVPSEIGSE